MQVERQHQSGFTFLEVIMAAFIGALLTTGGYMATRMVTQNYTDSFEEVQQIDEVGLIVRQFVNEAREARNGEDGAYTLAEANDNEIIFYSDVDNDGLAERIRYFVQGNSLKRGVVEPSGDPSHYNLGTETVKEISNKVVADGVSLFTYYNQDYPRDLVNNPIPLANRLLNTRAIKIHVKVNLGQDIEVQNLVWESFVQLRNLNTN